MEIARKSSLYKRQRIVFYGIFVIIIAMAVSVFIVPHVFADTGDWGADISVFEAERIFKSIDKVLGDESLRTQIFENAVFIEILAFLQTFAAGMVVVAIYIKIIKELQNGEATMDFWLRIFIMMALSIMAILMITDILNAIDSLGIYARNQLRDTVENNSSLIGGGGNTSFWGNMLDIFKDAITAPGKAVASALGDNASSKTKTVVAAIVDVVSLPAAKFKILGDSAEYAAMKALVWCMTTILLCRLYAQYFALLIEFVVRKIFAPIAMVNIVQNGQRGPGFTYLVKYFGLYIKEAMYYVIAFIMGVLVCWVFATMDEKGLASLCYVFAIYTAGPQLMSTSNEIINQILGV